MGLKKILSRMELFHEIAIFLVNDHRTIKLINLIWYFNWMALTFANRSWLEFAPHLQTTAGQAFGARNFQEVSLSLQRCVLFLGGGMAVGDGHP